MSLSGKAHKEAPTAENDGAGDSDGNSETLGCADGGVTDGCSVGLATNEAYNSVRSVRSYV